MPAVSARRVGYLAQIDIPQSSDRRTPAKLVCATESTEIDILGGNCPRGAPRCCLIGPIEVRVRDNLRGRRCSPCALVIRRVGVTDERYVIPSHESSVQR